MAEEDIAEAPRGAVDDDEAAAPPGDGAASRRRSLVPEQQEAAQLFALAEERYAAGDKLAALGLLERAHNEHPEDAPVCSWLGVLLAEERGQTLRGLELCGEALERDRSRPLHHFHLAKVHLRAGNKAEAIQVLRDGMREHPEDEQLRGALVTLGIRKPPPFSSLSRDHPLNKYTGIFLARLGLR